MYAIGSVHHTAPKEHQMSQTPVSSDLGGSTTDRLASMARDTIDRVTPKANRAEHEVRDAAARTTEGVKHLQEQAVDAAEEGLRQARSYIASNPLTTAGLAFAAGVLLSVVLIRR
jgi:ElaB/YqjD/DUF883 family membrane-anchored ribosome-binding protein